MKKGLPVIILKKQAFLPFETLNLKIDNELNKNVIDSSLYFNDGKLIILPQMKNEISKVGILAKIKNKELQKNGNYKVLLLGIERVNIIKFLSNETDILESIIEKFNNETSKEEKEQMKIFEQNIIDYFKKNKLESNILKMVKKSKNLSQQTDIIVNFFIKDNKTKFNFLYQINSYERMQNIQNHLKFETLKIKKIKNKVKNDSVQIVKYDGVGNIYITGNYDNDDKDNLLKVISLIKLNHNIYNIDKKELFNKDFHINLNIKESALQLYNLILKFILNKEYSLEYFIGNIDLNGNVIKVEDIKDVIINKYKKGIKKFIIPFDNKKDINLLDAQIEDEIEIIFVKNVLEIIGSMSNSVGGTKN